MILAFIELPWTAPETEALGFEGLEVVPRQRIEYRGVGVEEMDLEAVLRRRPEVAIGRRDRAYQRAGQPQPQALPGRDRAHRCRHQRDRRVQHPAPGVAQRSGRARHRRCGARDRPRQLPQASRPDRQSRPRGRRSAGAPEGGQDSMRRTRSRGRSSTSSSSTTCRRCASSPGARSPRAWARASEAQARRDEHKNGRLGQGRGMVCMSSYPPYMRPSLLRRGSSGRGSSTTCAIRN